MDVAHIRQHISENEKAYRAYCRKLYGGRYLAEDLFQEFYVRMHELKDRVPKTNLKNFCYATIALIHKEAKRKKSPLFEQSGAVEAELCTAWCETEFSEARLIAEVVEAHIEKKLKTQHDFLEMAVFDQAQNESLRSMERKTGIPFASLRRYYESARAALQELTKENLYL